MMAAQRVPADRAASRQELRSKPRTARSCSFRLWATSHDAGWLDALRLAVRCHRAYAPSAPSHPSAPARSLGKVGHATPGTAGSFPLLGAHRS